MFFFGFVLGLAAGACFVKSWHHKFLARGFFELADISEHRAITDVDVSRAFGGRR
jgi:hypothetical protein